MIDLHFHCLPGVDDGPGSWDEAVALCRAAQEEGTTTIVATPHVFRTDWKNDDEAARDALVLRLNAVLGGSPAVLPGCEVFLCEETAAMLSSGTTPLTGLNRSGYLLVELPAGPLWAGVPDMLYELSVHGVTPVLAHPERHPDLARDPERLASLVDRGVLAQITAGSLLGDFGRRAQEACEAFLGRDLIHFVASDAHSLDRRPPRLAAARERVRRVWGAERVTRIFERNPAAVLAAEPFPSLAPTAADPDA